MATGQKSASNNKASGDFKRPATPAEIAAARARGETTLESDIPDPNTNRTGYFNGTGFLPQLGNYAVDLLTGQPAIRAGTYAANGDWSNFGAQVGNMGGTPYGAHVFGQADGQVLAPNSGAFAPAATRAGSAGEFAGRAALGVAGGVSGAAFGQGAVNLATGGDKSGAAGGGSMGSNAAGVNAAADEILGYGKQNAAMYGQAGQKALGYYGAANAAYADTYGGGAGTGPQPYSGGGQTYGMAPGSQGLAGNAGTTGFTSTASPAPKANPWAPPTQQQQYAQGAQQRMAGPTAAQSYYAAYQPTNIAQGALANRQQNGYGASAVADRYASQVAQQNDPTASGSMVDYLAGYDPTSRGDSFSSQLQGMNASAQGNAFSNQLQGMNVAQRGDNFSNGLADANIGSNAANAQNRITSGQTSGGRLGTAVANGQTGSGQFINALASGNSATGQFGSYLNSGNSDTGRFLAGFDPNSTQALGENYQKLKAMGPTYEENFYTSQLAGDNPAYNQLKADYIKDQQRASAARGAFVSGSSMDLEQRGLTRLAADEFANRGNLAASAGNAQRAQAGLVSSAANNLDTNLLGRQGLLQKAGADREGILGSLAMNRDTVTGSTIGNQEDLLGKLATAGDADYSKLASDRDAGELQRYDILGRTAVAGDAANLQKQDLLGRTATAGDAANLQKQDLLGRTATAGDANALGLQNTRVSAASNQDQAMQARINANNQLANWTSTDQMDREKALDALTGVASGESISNAQTGGQIARNADISSTDKENALRLAASGASGEQAGNIKERFDESMRLGDAQSAISLASDMASIGALSQSQMAALNARIAAMGISSADRAALTQAQAQGAAAFMGMVTSIFNKSGGGSSSSSSTPVAGDGGAGGYIGYTGA